MAKPVEESTLKQLGYAFGMLVVVGALIAVFMAGIAYGEHECAEREHRALSSVG